MDISSITGMITGVLPYISYIVNLFNKLLSLVSSYIGIDITIPSTGEDEGGDTPEDEVTE